MPRQVTAMGLPNSAPIPESAREVGRQVDNTGLPDLCTIERNVLTSDGGGGFDDSWVPLAINVPCRQSPTTDGGEQVVARFRGASAGDRAVDETTSLIILPPDQDITESDRIVKDGTTYDVTMVRSYGGWEVGRPVQVKEAP